MEHYQAPPVHAHTSMGEYKDMKSLESINKGQRAITPSRYNNSLVKNGQDIMMKKRLMDGPKSHYDNGRASR